MPAPPALTPKKLREVLAKALDGDAPLECAARLLALLESTDAETAQELASHSKEWQRLQFGFEVKLF